MGKKLHFHDFHFRLFTDVWAALECGFFSRPEIYRSSSIKMLCSHYTQTKETASTSNRKWQKAARLGRAVLQKQYKSQILFAGSERARMWRCESSLRKWLEFHNHCPLTIEASLQSDKLLSSRRPDTDRSDWGKEAEKGSWNVEMLAEQQEGDSLFYIAYLIPVSDSGKNGSWHLCGRSFVIPDAAAARLLGIPSPGGRRAPTSRSWAWPRFSFLLVMSETLGSLHAHAHH